MSDLAQMPSQGGCVGGIRECRPGFVGQYAGDHRFVEKK
jgi:hypothetical protein